MKIIIFIFIFNGILIMMCKNETINLDNMCEYKKTPNYGFSLFCENLNLTNYSQDIEFRYIYGFNTVTCENCTIPKYSKNIFNRFQLREINLINCKIENVDQYVLDSFTNLGKLTLKNNFIKELYSNTFITSANRVYSSIGLYLTNNKIENIHEYCFKSTYITKIDLKSNQLTAIKKKMFAGATKLISLDLRNNLIKSIEEDSFLDEEKLEYLFLSNNKLIDIEKNTFSGLKSLRDLDLSYNLIKFIDSPAFQNTYSPVEIMNFSSNNIKDLYYDTFEGINLRTLILSNNKIEKFDTIVIYPIDNLRVLYIDGNQISEIDYEDPKFRFSKINLSYNKWNCTYLKNMIRFLNKDGTKYIIDKKPNTTQNVAGIGCTENDHQQEYKINYLQNVSEKTEDVIENTSNSAYAVEEEEKEEQEYKINNFQNISEKTEDVVENTSNCAYVDKLNKNVQNLSNKLENIELILKTSSATTPDLIVIIVLLLCILISLNIWIYVFYRNKFMQNHFKKNITEIHSLINTKDNI